MHTKARLCAGPGRNPAEVGASVHSLPPPPSHPEFSGGWEPELRAIPIVAGARPEGDPLRLLTRSPLPDGPGPLPGTTRIYF